MENSTIGSKACNIIVLFSKGLWDGLASWEVMALLTAEAMWAFWWSVYLWRFGRRAREDKKKSVELFDSGLIMIPLV